MTRSRNQGGQGAPRPALDGGTVDRFIERLECVKPVGDQRWIARCPAHDDRTPSLSVRATGDRILIYCFAGCPAEQILTAVGLTWRDLYGNANDAAYAAFCAMPRRSMQRPDILEQDRLILKFADALRRKGDPLSLEDEVRVREAIERLRGTSNG